MKKMKPSVLNVWKNRKNPQSKHLRIFLFHLVCAFKKNLHRHMIYVTYLKSLRC
jgi:hypothetical protein